MSLSALKLFKPHLKLFVARDAFTKHIQHSVLRQARFFVALNHLLKNGITGFRPNIIRWKNNPDKAYSSFSFILNDSPYNTEQIDGLIFHCILDPNKKAYIIYEIHSHCSHGLMVMHSVPNEEIYKDVPYIEITSAWVAEQQNLLLDEALEMINKGKGKALKTLLGFMEQGMFYSLECIHSHIAYLKEYSSGGIFDGLTDRIATQIIDDDGEQIKYINELIEQYETMKNEGKILFVNFIDESSPFSIAQALYAKFAIDGLSYVFNKEEFQVLNVIVKDGDGKQTPYFDIMLKNTEKAPLFHSGKCRTEAPETFSMCLGKSNPATDMLRGYKTKHPNHLMHFYVLHGLCEDARGVKYKREYHALCGMVSHQLAAMVGSVSTASKPQLVNLQGLEERDAILRQLQLQSKGVVILYASDESLQLAADAAAALQLTGLPFVTIAKIDPDKNSNFEIELIVDYKEFDYVGWTKSEIKKNGHELMQATIAKYAADSYQANDKLNQYAPYGFKDIFEVTDARHLGMA
ncbi:MAG: hypothetical protein ACFHVJ_10985 [Aestuariibacter sp.]